jgi:hypothetical protein
MEGAPVGIRLDTPAGMVVPDGVEAAGALTATGWVVALSIPLTVLGLDPATSDFALDLAINAVPPGSGIRARSYLAGVSSPYPSSDGYARVVNESHGGDRI